MASEKITAIIESVKGLTVLELKELIDREELDVEIKIEELFDVVEYDYPTFHLEMHCYICDLMSEKITLREHEDARWLKRDELDSVEWLPADRGLIEKLKQFL